MAKAHFIAAALLMTGIAIPASAQNNVIELLGQTNQEGNFIELNITGLGNGLAISQLNTSQAQGSNSIALSIDGDMNGGPEGASFTGIAAQSGLQPGTLLQEGSGNRMQVNVTGNSNLFAFLQKGTSNSLNAVVTGTGNQAVVQQYGQNNHVSLSQTGNGNSISISQRSF